jgi:hypothetical protein
VRERRLITDRRSAPLSPLVPSMRESRIREQVEPGPVGTALVVDEKPEFERRLEIVARKELLDGDHMRDARWSAGQLSGAGHGHDQFTREAPHRRPLRVRDSRSPQRLIRMCK